MVDPIASPSATAAGAPRSPQLEPRPRAAAVWIAVPAGILAIGVVLVLFGPQLSASCIPHSCCSTNANGTVCCASLQGPCFAWTFGLTLVALGTLGLPIGFVRWHRSRPEPLP
jgi:hypothetical protein